MLFPFVVVGCWLSFVYLFCRYSVHGNPPKLAPGRLAEAADSGGALRVRAGARGLRQLDLRIHLAETWQAPFFDGQGRPFLKSHVFMDQTFKSMIKIEFARGCLAFCHVNHHFVDMLLVCLLSQILPRCLKQIRVEMTTISMRMSESNEENCEHN